MQVASTVENRGNGMTAVTHNVINDGLQTVYESVISTGYLESNFDQVMQSHVATIKQSMKEKNRERDR